MYYVGMTKNGELNIVPKKLALLAPCLHVIPNGKNGLLYSEKQRYLDLMNHSRLKQNLQIR